MVMTQVSTFTGAVVDVLSMYMKDFWTLTLCVVHDWFTLRVTVEVTTESASVAAEDAGHQSHDCARVVLHNHATAQFNLYNSLLHRNAENKRINLCSYEWKTKERLAENCVTRFISFLYLWRQASWMWVNGGSRSKILVQPSIMAYRGLNQKGGSRAPP